MDNIISIDNIKFSYGKENVLNNIYLDLKPGMFYSIIGPNGSGKTTLLKTISKLLKIDHGKIMINNLDLFKMKEKEIAKNISIVPQNTNTDFEFKVLDMVLMGRIPHIKWLSSENENDFKVCEESMKKTKTYHLKDKNITEISGGERQRVILARALSQETEIMLLDEPVSHLDIYHQIEVMDTVKELIKNKKMTILMTLHDINLASEYSDYVIMMKNGEITSLGEPNEVINEENIERTYDIKPIIIKNPVSGKPHLIYGVAN